MQNITRWTFKYIVLIQLLISLLQLRNVNLSCVRTCMVVAEERPRIALTQSFSKIFKDLGLSPRAVSTTFGCRVNVAICLQVSSWWRIPQVQAKTRYELLQNSSGKHGIGSKVWITRKGRNHELWLIYGIKALAVKRYQIWSIVNYFVSKKVKINIQNKAFSLYP